MDFRKLVDHGSLVYPRPVIPTTNLVAGILLFVIVAASMLLYWSMLAGTWDALFGSISQLGNAENYFLSRMLDFPEDGNVALSVYLVALALQITLFLFIPIYLWNVSYILYYSLKKICRAALQFTSSGIPEGIPIKYADTSSVVRFIGDKEEYRCRFASTEMISVFGYNVQYISPAAAEVAEAAAKRVVLAGKAGLRRAFIPIFWSVVLVCFLISFASWDSISNIFPTLYHIMHSIGKEKIASSIIEMYFIYAVVILCCLFLDWLFVKILASRPKPAAQVFSRAENAQVAVAPYLLSERFQQNLERAERENGKADRVYRTSNENASISMNDMGNFALLGLVEQHPWVIPNPNMKAGLFRLWSGWALIFVGALFLTIFLLPSATSVSLTVKKLTEWRIFVDPLVLILSIIIGRRALHEGIAMVASGEAILETYWFEAPSLRYDLRGVTAKSEIRVGGARDDSIRTSSSLARSEFVARLTATNLVSEVSRPTAERVAYSMAPAKECLVLVEEVLKSLRDLSDLRPAPIGVDLSGRDIADTIDANAAAHAAKKSALRYAEQRAVRSQHTDRALPSPRPEEE